MESARAGLQRPLVDDPEGDEELDAGEDVLVRSGWW